MQAGSRESFREELLAGTNRYVEGRRADDPFRPGSYWDGFEDGAREITDMLAEMALDGLITLTAKGERYGGVEVTQIRGTMPELYTNTKKKPKPAKKR